MESVKTDALPKAKDLFFTLWADEVLEMSGGER